MNPKNSIPERIKAIQLPNGTTAQVGPQQVSRIVASPQVGILLEGNKFTVTVKSATKTRTFKVPMSSAAWYEPMTEAELEQLNRPVAVTVDTVVKTTVNDTVKFVKGDDGVIRE